MLKKIKEILLVLKLRCQLYIQLLDIKDLYDYLGVSMNLFRLDLEIFDIRNDKDQSGVCVYIPEGMTVQSLVEFIDSDDNRIKVCIEGWEQISDFENRRSNLDNSYLVIIDEGVEFSGEIAKSSTALFNTTLLELLLYYVISYWKSGDFNRFDRPALCRGTYRGKRVAKVDTCRENAETMGTDITLVISITNNVETGEK